MLPEDLPAGNRPRPLDTPHFPDRLHAYVWRNWSLAPVERLAAVVGATPHQILGLASSLGLPSLPAPTRDQQHRLYITAIRRNWHLLPYWQLLELLDWTPERLAYTLREDDFLFIKLGSLKPACESLHYQVSEAAEKRAREIAALLRQELPEGIRPAPDPMFRFVHRLSQPPTTAKHTAGKSRFSPRYCYSYFALYGDPLLEPEEDPYPDGYLERLAQSGVNGVWLQALLQKLAPFPWDPAISTQYQERLANLRKLVERAHRHGIALYLYLNEPRALPVAFFEKCPELRGVTEGDYATLCTSHPEVQAYIIGAVASICRAAPGLGGFFTITASENLTNCWSHGAGASCPRCGPRGRAEVLAGVNGLIQEGIRRSEAAAELIAWDWGWPDDSLEAIVERLPGGTSLMSTSERSLPIHRGGVETIVDEYSISAIGPGPRALRLWDLGKKRGLKTMAKMQVGNTWELSAVPYIPALENVARHAANLRDAGVGGLMLGWTLGGYPSPNLEVVQEIGSPAAPSPAAAMETVAVRRFGAAAAPLVVEAWKEISTAFQEFPFHIGVVYQAPLQMGPANLLWAAPTGYGSTMVGFPYDDLTGWRGPYPPEIFITQLDKVAAGFEAALEKLRLAHSHASGAHAALLQDELNVAGAAAIHFRSTANQARFVLARDALAGVAGGAGAATHLAQLETVLREEMTLALRLYHLQTHDSRIGFEATNHYFYVPMDLLEKVINCHDLLTRWLPAERRRLGPG